MSSVFARNYGSHFGAPAGLPPQTRFSQREKEPLEFLVGDLTTKGIADGIGLNTYAADADRRTSCRKHTVPVRLGTVAKALQAKLG